MKKLFTAILCTVLLSACTANKPSTDPTPTPTAQGGQSTGLRTMISSTSKNPIGDDWTILGEVGIIIDNEYADILLATEAERGEDGNMMWDDAQKWALAVIGEENNYTLFNSLVDGQMYIDVATENDLPTISLIHTSTVGMSVTKYTYSDGAFYAEELITPSANGNNIYSSFPQYTE